MKGKCKRTAWTPIQLQNRKRRRFRGYVMRFGLPTPKGTRPREFKPSVEPPILKPMPNPSFGFDSLLGLAYSFMALMPWMRRRRAESRLAEQRRAQAMKAKEVSTLYK